MRFQTPLRDRSFEIPDEWWLFAEMDGFFDIGSGYYPYDPTRAEAEVHVVELLEIEPPERNPGVELLRKHKLVPVLFALQSPDGELPPVEINIIPSGGRYRFKVYNGYHRYYASVAVGYRYLPVVIRPPLDLGPAAFSA